MRLRARTVPSPASRLIHDAVEAENVAPARAPRFLHLRPTLPGGKGHDPLNVPVALVLLAHLDQIRYDET